MYIPKAFRQEDRAGLIETIKTLSFGALVIFAEDRFFAAHIPFIVKEEKEHLILEGHVSKANEIWKIALPEHKAMVIFQGNHAYIHPGWYATKVKTGKVVPTWNYQAIHCYGEAHHHLSAPWILKHVTELTQQHEKDQEKPWAIADAPKDYIDTLTQGIVGITLSVKQIEGSLKMNQHHVDENRISVIEGLSKTKEPHACAVAHIMQKLLSADKTPCKKSLAQTTAAQLK